MGDTESRFTHFEFSLARSLKKELASSQSTTSRFRRKLKSLEFRNFIGCPIILDLKLTLLKIDTYPFIKYFDQFNKTFPVQMCLR